MKLGSRLTESNRKKLYAVSEHLGTEIERAIGLQIPFDVYFQDPLVAAQDSQLALDEEFYVEWEPGLCNGPTSARFAVVDYNGDTGTLAPPAEWDNDKQKFVYDGRVLDKLNKDPLQFHQVNVWAILQRALAFFEGGYGLGRRVPWGFEGNRLIVTPHAGYGENAFYDRRSKSLQFYYFDRGKERIFTCLSTDIINHEFGHAVLDGIRPHYLESSSVQTAAFHEFMGDLTAILIILRNNTFRQRLAEKTRGDLTMAENLSSIAEQFGWQVSNKPYLRTAQNKLKMSDVRNDKRAHYVSQVLTGAMFDILLSLTEHFLEERGETPKQAFWHAVERMQRIAIQPLDLLPPVEVTFKDYALAVLRADKLSNPVDPYDYYGKMLTVFRDREIIDAAEEEDLRQARYLHNRLNLSVYHDIDSISRSRSAAYRFLHDNREELYIPLKHDFVVADLYDANRKTRRGRQLPRQIMLQYIWREDVKLEGPQYGAHNGEMTTLLCGGTLVFDENGNVLSWFRKPGTDLEEERHIQSWYSSEENKNKKAKKTKKQINWENEVAQGKWRRDHLLKNVEKKVALAQVGVAPESEQGLLGSHMPPVTARKIDGIVRFEVSPHLHLTDDDEDLGGRQWEISF